MNLSDRIIVKSSHIKFKVSVVDSALGWVITFTRDVGGSVLSKIYVTSTAELITAKNIGEQ